MHCCHEATEYGYAAPKEILIGESYAAFVEQKGSVSNKNGNV